MIFSDEMNIVRLDGKVKSLEKILQEMERLLSWVYVTRSNSNSEINGLGYDHTLP